MSDLVDDESDQEATRTEEGSERKVFDLFFDIFERIRQKMTETHR